MLMNNNYMKNNGFNNMNNNFNNINNINNNNINKLINSNMNIINNMNNNANNNMNKNINNNMNNMNNGNMNNNANNNMNNNLINNMNNVNYGNMNNLINNNTKMDNNIIFNAQLQIYNNISSKNFKNRPSYSNGLNINNAKIPNENKLLLIKLSKITKYSLITPLEIIYKEQYGIFTKTTNEREKCPICLCEFYDDIIEEDPKNLNLKPINIYINHEIDTAKLNKCEDHFYHIECLSNYIKKEEGFKCAVCQKIYGIIIGDMPPGIMSARIDKNLRCAGYYKDDTIVINYSFQGGKTKDGNYYSGTARTSYLPNNKEGREILGMLKIAFDRKLTFTIGTSVTTGQKNTVIWNGIHHKTSTSGGIQYYGYPDPTYFNRIKEELASKGIYQNDFKNGELENIAKGLIYSY